MDRLWTPWRYSYITGEGASRAEGVPEALTAWIDADPTLSQSTNPYCVFCNMLAAVRYAIAHGMQPADAEREALILQRGPRTFLCLNRFPYSSGHVLVIPYEHCASLAQLDPVTACEIITVAQTVESALRAVYHPDGLNLGLNLGKSAGAGVADHLHLHILPRWTGDTNFMTVTAETRVLPEMLETSWQRLRDAIAKLAAE